MTLVNYSKIKRAITLVHIVNMLYIWWFGMNSGYKPLMTEGQLCLRASSSNWNNKTFLVYHNKCIIIRACIPLLINFNETKFMSVFQEKVPSFQPLTIIEQAIYIKRDFYCLKQLGFFKTQTATGIYGNFKSHENELYMYNRF